MTGPPGLVARRLTTCMVMAGLRVDGRPWKVSPCMVSTSSRSSEGLGSRLLHVYTTHESSGRMRTALWAPVDIAPYTRPRAGGASEQKRGRSVRAFGKDRARETQAPARSILAAVPTPLGPPVGCHPTPSDGIAHATVATNSSTGKGLKTET